MISRDDSHETTLFYTGVIGFLTMSVLVTSNWIEPTTEQWFWLVVAGVGGTLAHVCIIIALHMAPASILQPFNYTNAGLGNRFGFPDFRRPAGYLDGGRRVGDCRQRALLMA